MRANKVVSCAAHGRAVGYIVCKHIVNEGAAVGHILAPHAEPTGIGEILCDPDRIHTADDLVLICEHCANGAGYTKQAKPVFQ